MDQPEKSQPVVGYTSPPYQTVSTPSSNIPPATGPAPPPSTKLAFPQPQPFNQQPDQIEVFWTKQLEEAEQVLDFKIHSLPLARIKKIMKADEDVRMISAEAPVVFAKACEMFILELTLRSWIHTEENKRRTLQKNDIAAAISRTDVFDFLVDIIPRDELKEDGLKSVIPMVGGPADMPYYFVPPQHHHHHPMGATGMMMGNPVDQAVMYGGGPQPRPPPPVAFMPWPPTQAQQPMSHQQQQTES